jgi:hypothetical protein
VALSTAIELVAGAAIALVLFQTSWKVWRARPLGDRGVGSDSGTGRPGAGGNAAGLVAAALMIVAVLVAGGTILDLVRAVS